MPRIVSLIPSATEIVHLLGFSDQLVGRSHECDFPPAVERLPVCTEPKLRTDVPSLEIDRQVKEILLSAMSVYRVFTDTLETLRPEVIITQSQCEICAVSLKDVEAAVCELIACKPQIVSLEPMSLADVWSDIRKVAAALAVPETGETAIAALQARLNAISQTAGQLTRRPRIATIEWIDPVMAGGNWMPELVTLAGGENLFGTPGEHSPWVSLEEIAVADPEMLVVLPCGFGIERSLQEMDALERNPVWQTLRAVQQHQVYITDGNHYFNRPGPRLVESVEILAEILHPGVFNFGHRGTGWVPYQPALSAR